MLISAEFLAGGNAPMKSCRISSYFLCTNITILEYETHQKSYKIRKCYAIIWIRGIEELNFQDVLSTRGWVKVCSASHGFRPDRSNHWRTWDASFSFWSRNRRHPAAPASYKQWSLSCFRSRKSACVTPNVSGCWFSREIHGNPKIILCQVELNH